MSKVYGIITDRIMGMLEAGVVPWRQPWKYARSDAQFPSNCASRRDYRGINVPMLHCTAQMEGYPLNWWLTYKQAKERGGQVRKGEKSTPVVFWKIGKYEDELVAEMGAAFLSGRCGIEPVTLEDSASYIASWLKILKGDSRMVVKAAAAAQKAADFILGTSTSEKE